MSGLTAVSLFAGVGGIDLALQRAGVKVTAAVEIDDAARGVIADRLPTTPQGFPDDWTATSNGKPQADSARYRQMGNAVAVPCVEWIARRIVSAA